MPKRTLTSFLEEVRHEVALQECGPLSDPDLLERFVSRRDETAFAALVARHGPMVFGVCRRLLERTEDAEDASQATFLVLARKAAGIRKRESLPSWLHGVASRVARKSRADILRKRGREAPGVELPQRDTLGDVTWREALAVLDEELNRLPENYRSALVLCYLEGKTQDEAARELGWSLGALRGRLERGRERLRTRVSRRGISLATVLLGAGLSSGFARAAVSRAFVTATAKAATIFASRQAAALAASARAAALAKGALATMRITKLCVAALLFTACIGFVVGAVTVRSALRGGPEAAANEAPEASAPGKPGTQAAANEAPEGPAPGKPVWQPRAVIGGHFGSQCYVELAPDGKTLVTFNPAKSDLAFWDVATWKERAIHPLNKVFSGGGSYSMPLFSPDGKMAVAEGRHAGEGGRAGPAVALFDVVGGKVRAVLPGGAPGFSPDGKLLAVSTADAIALYDAATAKERLTFPVKGSRSRWANHHGRRFSPDGKILATAQDGVVRLWDTAIGKELATLSGYLPVTNHEMTPFSPDGKTLVTAEQDRTVRLWDVATGKERAALTGHKAPYIAAIFSPDGKTVATLGTWYGVQAGAPQQVAPEESFLLRPVEVKLWDTGTGKAILTLPGNTYHDDRAQFSSDGKTLAYRRGVAGEQAQCVVLWDIVAGKELAVIPGDHVGRFSPDGKLLLVQSPDGGVTFRDTVTGQVVSAVQGDAERQVSFLSISPDWRLLATSAFFVGKRGEGKIGKPGAHTWDTTQTRITVFEFSDRPVKKEALGGPKSDGGAEPAPAGAKNAGFAPRGETWEALKREIEAADTEFLAKRRAAKTDKEVLALEESLQTGREAFARRALDLAGAHPESPATIEALEFALRNAGSGSRGRLREYSAEAVRLVRRDQLKSPALDRLLPWLASQKSDLAEALLAQAVEQSPHRAVRGRGALWLARTLAEQAETAQQIRASPEVELLFKDQPEYLNRLKAMDSAKSNCRAEELFELMRKDYADVLQYDGRPTTLGAMAERGLFALRNLAVGKEAPEIRGEDLDGRPLKLSDSRGKVVVLVFCGYWCGPCRAMIPQEKALVKKMAGKPFALFWVNSDKDRVLAKEKMEKDGANWRSWWDGGRQDGPIGSRWNVDGFPTVYVIDGKGIIRLKSMGRPGEALDRTVDRLLRKELGDGTQGGDLGGQENQEGHHELSNPQELAEGGQLASFWIHNLVRWASSNSNRNRAFTMVPAGISDLGRFSSCQPWIVCGEMVAFSEKESPMPLRDHFRPPVESKHSWDELHGMWPAVIVQQLFPILPDGYVAVPSVHLGTAFEIDVSAYEQDRPEHADKAKAGNGAVAVATWAPAAPTLTLETELPDQDEYEVRVYDTRHGRRLVAAIELVSPANKDRPENRRAFVAKVAALLQHDVCVSLVDVVSIRQFNLYADLLELIGRTDLTVGAAHASLYAATLRGRKPIGRCPLLDTWFYAMSLGQPLPTLPIGLDVDLGVLLDLEKSYEETCRVLHIT